MAKCNLSLELQNAEQAFVGGQTVEGTVIVQVDTDVFCKGLEVKTCWATHGFGNVAQGTGQSTRVFEGQWTAGQTYRYDFRLQTARWPPTYHGHYLNVDHAVEARVNIPWSIDPKTSQPIQVIAADGPESQAVAAVTQASGIVKAGCTIFGVMFALIFSVVLLVNPFAWIFGLLIGMIAAIWWFVFRFLPRARLGEVHYRLDTPRLAPGQEVIGELVLRPKKNIRLNRILWKVAGTEICVSGSGSNRTTRRHVIHEAELEVAGPMTLPAEQETRIPLRARLPEVQAYSLDLSDNDLKWTSDLRIDIPRWPDWKTSSEFLVVPPTAVVPGDVPPLPPDAPFASQPTASFASPAEPAAEPLSFEETIGHLWAARGDDAQTELLIDAVEGIPFAIEALIERRLLYGSDDPGAYRDGYVIWAHYPNPEMPLTLYAPRHLGDEFEQIGGALWRGRGRITGYDRRHGRVQIHLDEPTDGGVGKSSTRGA